MKHRRFYIFLIAAAAIAAVLISGCGKGSASSDPVMGDNYLLDTICTISIYRMSDGSGEAVPASEMAAEAGAAIDEAFDLCSDLESKLSRTKEGSDISRINEAGGEWTEVSEDTLDILQKGLGYSRESGGAFDITIGGVTDLWDFHADPEDAEIPAEADLAEAVKHVDFEAVDIEGGKVRLSDPAARIDLGGIAKGYIGDRMTEVLERRGAVSAVINLGGNVICIGGKTDSDDFVIGVETPFSDRSEIIGSIEARDKTLVTSGVYERRIEVDGRSYHHILDTASGWPVSTDLDAVTLIADKGRSGDIDALSTICLIKGSEEGLRLIESMEGVDGVLVLSDGSVLTTEGAGFKVAD